jgi:NDP-sugar pyrophosphorylase family protein
MKAFVLAAGKGARLGELSEHFPKPMVKVGGMPVLERNLRWLQSHGVSEVMINLHHLGEVIEKQIGNGGRLGLGVRYSREPELLGTAGGVKQAEEFLRDRSFLVVYGDNLFDFDLERMIEAHSTWPCVATIALYSLDQHQHSGVTGGRVDMDRSGRILRFVEGGRDPAAASLRLINAACYILEPSVLAAIPAGQASDFGKDVFPKLLRSHQILCGHVIEPEGKVLGLDTPEALARARALFPEEHSAGERSAGEASPE